MFVHRIDPGPHKGVGVAFTSAELDLSDRQPAEARTAAYATLSESLGVPVAVARQVHGAEVLWVGAQAAASGLIDLTAHEADALVTTQRGVGVAVRVADCVPILIADADAAAVAAVHAGRVGLLSGVIEAAVAALREVSAAPLRAWVGPHICGTCYEVPPEMAQDAAARLGIPVPTTRWGTPGIDLGQGAVCRLTEAGVEVTEVNPCTLEGEHLHSHRGNSAGRLAGIIWLAP